MNQRTMLFGLLVALPLTALCWANLSNVGPAKVADAAQQAGCGCCCVDPSCPPGCKADCPPECDPRCTPNCCIDPACPPGCDASCPPSCAPCGQSGSSANDCVASMQACCPGGCCASSCDVALKNPACH